MSDIAEPAGSRSPRRTLLVTLPVLALSWFAFPAPVASWLYDNCGEALWCPPLQAVADGVETASRTVGVAGFMDDSRSNLRTLFGIDFY